MSRRNHRSSSSSNGNGGGAGEQQRRRWWWQPAAEEPKLNQSSSSSPPHEQVIADAAPVAIPGIGMNQSPDTSPARSCVSSEDNLKYSSSPESSSPMASTMVVAGCPGCLLYVMLPEDDRRCPQCKSTVLLDFREGGGNGLVLNGGGGGSRRNRNR